MTFPLYLLKRLAGGLTGFVVSSIVIVTMPVWLPVYIVATWVVTQHEDYERERKYGIKAH